MSEQSSQIEGAASPSDDEKLEGIGGWLIPLAIAQVLGVVFFLMSMIANFSILPPETATVQPVAFFGTIMIEGAFLLLLVYTAFLFFTKSGRFPTTFIVSCVAGMIEPVILAVWLANTAGIESLSSVTASDGATGYLVMIAGSILWIAYVLNSVRVRNTFTH